MLHKSTNEQLKRTRKEAIRAFLLAASLALGACAGGPAKRAEQGAETEAAYPPAATDRYARALGLMDAGDYSRAQRELVLLTEKFPDLAGPYHNLALIEADKGSPDNAAALLKAALERCLRCAASWNQLGILHRQAGRFAEAEGAYLSAVENEPGYALAHYNLGVLYDLYQQRHELAVQHYERYVSLSGDADAIKQVDKWIADLRRRLAAPQRAAQAGEL